MAPLPDPSLVDLAFDDAKAMVAADPGRTPVLGLQGPQGGGKTTLAAAVVARASAASLRFLAISIDDFYRTRREQLALAASAPGDPLLAVRGGPGTHDVELGSAVLDALTRRAASSLLVPVYDKSAWGGAGDRAPEAAWRKVALPLDLVILEGWLLGFPSLGARLPDPSLQAADARLAAYAPWTRRLDGMIQLRTTDPETIVRWRMEAEARQRAAGRDAMSDAQAEAYIRRFLPFYAVYPEALAAAPPRPARHRVLWLDALRRRVA